jgi:hypothetical protein
MEEEYPQGAANLDATERWLRKFVRFQSDAHYTLATLWVAGSHMTGTDGSVTHNAYGRLAFVSDQPSSGKTTAMERVLALTPRGETLIQPSMAGILDAVEARRVIGIDEADQFFGKNGSMRGVVAFLNAGYRRNGGTVRYSRREVPSYSLVTFSGLAESLRVSSHLGPLRTRTFMVEMVPAIRGTKLEEFDDEQHEYIETMIKDALESWGRTVAPHVSGMAVTTPDSVSNRRAQIWRPLLRVAALAGAEWPRKAWEACEEMESGIDLSEPVPTPEQRIMTDVLTVAGSAVKLPTKQLLERLYALPESPWKFVFTSADDTGSARELARLLEPHGLRSKDVYINVPDIGRLPYKGYDLSDHQDCRMCTGTSSHADGLGSHADETGARTDESSTEEDADAVTVPDVLPVPTPVAAPVQPPFRPVVAFSG